MTAYHADFVRYMTMHDGLSDVRRESVYEGEARGAESCIVEPGQYGQWSLWKSTIFKHMYTAKHPTHGEVWIDAARDGQALADFRRVVRSRGGRT